MSGDFVPLLSALLGSLVGLSLGLTGGGGVVVALPLLIYGLHFNYHQATVFSLIVVGATALFGALVQTGKGQVQWLIGLLLGCGGIPTISIGKWVSSKVDSHLLMLLFTLLMGLVAFRMLFRGHSTTPPLTDQNKDSSEERTPLSSGRILILLLCGGIVGVLSGTFGIGGGFFLVPALDFFLKLPIKQAMATSLVGIFIIAASGFANNFEVIGTIDPWIGSLFFLGSIGGIVLGSRVKEFISERALEKIFGVYILGMTFFVLFKNI